MVGHVVGLGAGKEAAQHGQHRVRHDVAHRKSLGQIGDEKVPATGRMQCRGDLASSETIGIGLDDRRRRTRRMLRLQRNPVRHDGTEVDLQHRLAGGWPKIF